MLPINPLLSRTGVTVFESMSMLARQHDAVNLGQGFPDEPGPPDVLQAAAAAVLEGPHQYPPMMGMPGLRQAVAEHMARFYGQSLDWQTEVLVTSGATEALLTCFAALLSPGDEAIVLEPAYDTYAPTIRLLGATPRAVRLAPPAWHVPWDELARAVTPATKLLVVNSPMNPCGKVFALDELMRLSEFVRTHNLYVVLDEVYEHLVYDNKRHVSLTVQPDMHDRCVRIGSAGKTFSLTGWKVGYVTGPAALIAPIAKAHQLAMFATPPHLQQAVAVGLRMDASYVRQQAATFAQRRDRLMHGLAGMGIAALPASGGYFVVLDMAAFMMPGETDHTFCQRLVVEAGVVFIPLSAFYELQPPRTLVRACFAKSEATIDAALGRLRTWVSARPHNL